MLFRSQIFRGTSVEGQLEAVDNTADNVIETDTRKFMTAKDRQSIDNVSKSIDNVVKRVDGLTTDNVPETDTHKYFPPNFNADDLSETDDRKFMTAAEREKIAGLNKQIEDSCAAVQNACVTDSRSAGGVNIVVTTNTLTEMASGYFVTSGYYVGSQLWMSGRQPQLKIANRGWFPLAQW